MTIKQALQALVSYPVPALFIDKICLQRSLLPDSELDASAALSEKYELAEADLYMYMYTAPDLKEQEISISVKERRNYFHKAQIVYGKYDDEKHIGLEFGFIGENYNG